MGGAHKDVAEALRAATPGLRRYARALLDGDATCAQALLEAALRSVAERDDASSLSERDARLSAYAALTALGAHKRMQPKTGGAKPGFASALAGLGHCDRCALLLVVVESFSYDDAAEILGLSRDALLSRLMRARSELTRAETPGKTSELRKPQSHLRLVK